VRSTRKGSAGGGRGRPESRGARGGQIVMADVGRISRGDVRLVVGVDRIAVLFRGTK
jgi:hypothetical protein